MGETRGVTEALSSYLDIRFPSIQISLTESILEHLLMSFLKLVHQCVVLIIVSADRTSFIVNHFLRFGTSTIDT